MLQNRVDPWGQLRAVAERGTLMGNRGILHDDEGRIVRPWAHKAWVVCLLSFKGMRRPRPFSPGNYSELFFLDEATALAAGHRPCTYCQRERSNAFKAAWVDANVALQQRAHFRLSALDSRLHQERVVRGGGKVTYRTAVASLPIGTMFALDGAAFLVHRAGHRPWSFGGYGAAVHLPPHTPVDVLTPKSVVAALACGFEPRIHESAGEHHLSSG